MMIFFLRARDERRSCMALCNVYLYSENSSSNEHILYLVYMRIMVGK